VPLAAAMCSAVFGFEIAELAEIRAETKDGFFYTAFLMYAESGEDAALREKCAAAATKLARWRDEERFMRLDDFLWKLMRESGFYDYSGTLPRGAQRQANLRALLERAASFQKGRVAGLRGFLGFLDRIKMRGDVAQVTLVTDSEDVCRIMTIHGSKGLEFPVVILGGLGRSFSAGGFNDDSLLLSRDAGLSLYWEDHASHTYKKTLLHSALKLRQEITERAEAIRLLYVGMTRAMDTLHMIGTTGDPEKWEDLFGAAGSSPDVDTDIFGAANYLQLIMPTAFQRRTLFKIEIADPSEPAEWETKGDGSSVLQILSDPGKTDEPSSSVPDESAEPFVYPYTAAARLKSKYSVTELNRRAFAEMRSREDKDPEVVTPVFFMAGSMDEAVEDAGLTAAEKGTALHKALELMDFGEACAHRDDRLWFESYLDGLTASGSLSRAETDSVGVETLLLFANSDIAARAATSGFLMKEAPFNMKLPYREAAGGVEEQADSDDEIIVQGVIDCLFEEEDGFVLVDYKSGRFDITAYEREAESVRERYGHQIQLYSRAAELIFEKPVKERFVYMTQAGVAVGMSVPLSSFSGTARSHSGVVL
jgi:ATP-dependent helicase/nuclease subunit A